MMRLIHTNQTQTPAADVEHEPFDAQLRFNPAPGENADWIQAILARRAISIHLQPLVSLSHGGIIGYEALARGPEHSPFFQAGALFGAAAQAGLTLEMEALCVAHALRQLPRLPAHTQLFVNAGPSLLSHGALGALLHASPLRHHFHNLVMEITEHEPFGEPDLLRQAIRNLHALGISVALDDFGCGFADLKTVKYLKPDIVKITLEMIRNRGPAAESAQRLSSLCSLLKRHGALVVVEGVETGEQAMAVEQCGAHWAQGYYFSRPRPARDFTWNQSPARQDNELSRIPGMPG